MEQRRCSQVRTSCHVFGGAWTQAARRCFDNPADDLRSVRNAMRDVRYLCSAVQKLCAHLGLDEHQTQLILSGPATPTYLTAVSSPPMPLTAAPPFVISRSPSPATFSSSSDYQDALDDSGTDSGTRERSDSVDEEPIAKRARLSPASHDDNDEMDFEDEQSYVPSERTTATISSTRGAAPAKPIDSTVIPATTSTASSSSSDALSILAAISQNMIEKTSPKRSRRHSFSGRESHPTPFAYDPERNRWIAFGAQPVKLLPAPRSHVRQPAMEPWAPQPAPPPPVADAPQHSRDAHLAPRHRKSLPPLRQLLDSSPELPNDGLPASALRAGPSRPGPPPPPPSADPAFYKPPLVTSMPLESRYYEQPPSPLLAHRPLTSQPLSSATHMRHHLRPSYRYAEPISPQGDPRYLAAEPRGMQRIPDQRAPHYGPPPHQHWARAPDPTRPTECEPPQAQRLYASSRATMAPPRPSRPQQLVRPGN